MSISESDITTAKNLIEQAIRESYPEISLAKGSPASQLIVNLAALGYAAIKEQFDILSSSQSLYEIAENLDELEDTSLIDSLLSNWKLTRIAGTKATGYVILYFTEPSLADFSILDTEEFIYDIDYSFYPVMGYTVGLTLGDVSGELKLYEYSGSEYYSYCIVPLIADVIGSVYNVEKDSEFDSGFDNGIAYADFSGGADLESVSSVMTRLDSSVSKRDLTTKRGIISTLEEEYTSINQIVPIGLGDRELHRANNNHFGTMLGNYVDVYCKTSETPLLKNITVAVDAVSNDFYLTLTNEGIPFYRVESIVLASNPSVVASGYTYDFDYEISFNDLKNLAVNARFTKYEKVKITMSDLGYNFKGLDVVVTLSYPPDIADIQSYCNLDANRPASYDVLVKSMVPCFVTCEIYPTVVTGYTTTSTVELGVYNYINTLPPGSKLTKAGIITVVESYTGYSLTEQDITLTGSVFFDSVFSVELADAAVLEIPDSYAYGFSENNACFQIFSSDVVIGV